MDIKFLLSILYVIGLYGSYMAGFFYLRHKSIKLYFPRITVLFFFMIAVPSTLQFIFPSLLTTLQRDPVRFFHGEGWRLVTALFVQDGGIAGTIFNLISLLFVGAIAEQLWTSRDFLLLFLIGGIVGQIVAFTWQPIGAGNSVGNFSLAASIAVVVFIKSSLQPARIAALLAVATYIVLLALTDIHGAASLTGITLASFLVKRGANNFLSQPGL
jgi:membrane associated rhomboid family serine protease